MRYPRIVISGLAGSSGKTLLSLGLCRAFSKRGLTVLPAKKGPDYIDAAWLTQAAGIQAINLDPYFLKQDGLLTRFGQAWERTDAQLAVIEGNRGIFDGHDTDGSCSTAQVAAWLNAPVILALNCAKMTRTAAALVTGVITFDPSLQLSGVILNNVGSVRHMNAIRQAIEKYSDIPVLGGLPRLLDNPLPERYMGLVGGIEKNDDILDILGKYISKNLELDRILDIAKSAPELIITIPKQITILESSGANSAKGANLSTRNESVPKSDSSCDSDVDTDRAYPSITRIYRPHIGYVRDAALWFYYQENLEALREAGADLLELSVLDPARWPKLDGLYLGGGFPEQYAEKLSCTPHIQEIQSLAAKKRPVYAECGGFIFLCQALHMDECTWPMAGLLPAECRFFPRPQSLGYIEATTIRANPFHPIGSVWRGHEFAYSRFEATPGNEKPDFVLRLNPGRGMSPEGGHDGLCSGNTFASYAHLYAPVVPHWAPTFVNLARGLENHLT